MQNLLHGYLCLLAPIPMFYLVNCLLGLSVGYRLRNISQVTFILPFLGVAILGIF